LLVEHFPEKSDPYLSSNRRRPSTADLEAHSWINERLVVAHSCPGRVRRHVRSWRKATSHSKAHPLVNRLNLPLAELSARLLMLVF
jgi:hypothetical protein